MRARLFSLIAILAHAYVGLAQTQVDSLLKIVSRNEGDAQSFYAFKQLGKITEDSNPKQAIAYYRHTLQFPIRTIYAKDFVEASNSLAELYQTLGRYDSSSLVYEQSIVISQKFNFAREEAIANQGIALNYMNQSILDSAKFYFGRSVSIAVQIKDLSLQASGRNNLGNLALEETKYPEALEQFIEAAKIYESVKNKQGLAKSLANIGNIQNILGQYDKALDYTQRAQKIFEETNNERSLAYCYRLLGRIYRKQKKLDKSLDVYQRALAVYKKVGDLRNEGETHQSIGNIYFDLKKIQAALNEFEKSIRIAKAINNPSQLAYTFSGMGVAWYQLKKHDKAIAYFDSSIAKAREVKNRYLVMDAYEAKSEIYEDLKNYKEALALRHLFTELKDSIANEENREAAAELEAKYQSSQKQTEIELLKKDQLLQNASLKQSRILQTALITAVALLLVIGLLIFNRNKVINHSKRLMEIERVRNQIARDLHDDMGSTLSSINLISQVALKDNSIDSKSKYFQRIGEQSSKIMESMSDMVWSINPENDSFQKTIAKMKEFCAEILEPRNIGFTFLIDEALNSISLDVAKRKNLFLIFKETINNAAKYSSASFVNIQFSKTETGVFLVIRDNGKGFEISNQSNGNGLRNMKERAREIDATLSLESTVGSGTSLMMNLSLT
ncbi:MAG: tetratricopeptide repeat protein [Cyclobacteriaceae bacterium]